MLTRGTVGHQYGQTWQGDWTPPPYHAPVQPLAPPRGRPLMSRYGGGGLAGGAVALNTAGWVGISRGNSGYGYLGMDPSDATTWPRPFNPAPGMIAYLNWSHG